MRGIKDLARRSTRKRGNVIRGEKKDSGKISALFAFVFPGCFTGEAKSRVPGSLRNISPGMITFKRSYRTVISCSAFYVERAKSGVLFSSTE